MLEIFALWILTRRIGDIVERKGRKSGWYKVLTVVLWFGGEFAGALLGAIMTGVNESGRCTAYLFALLGAVIGAGVAYFIANNLSPIASSRSSLPITFKALDTEELLRDLQPGQTLDTIRALAARRLGQLSVSNPQVVNALITAAESDITLAVREEAAESLRSPAHQTILQQHPDLADRIRAIRDVN